jgi:hypothetical protein
LADQNWAMEKIKCSGQNKLIIPKCKKFSYTKETRRQTGDLQTHNGNDKGYLKIITVRFFLLHIVAILIECCM